MKVAYDQVFESVADDVRSIGLAISCVSNLTDFDYNQNVWIHNGVHFNEMKLANRLLLENKATQLDHMTPEEKFSTTAYSLYNDYLQHHPLVADSIKELRSIVNELNENHLSLFDFSRENIMLNIASRLDEKYTFLEKAAIVAGINPSLKAAPERYIVYGFDSFGSYLQPPYDAIYTDLTKGKFADYEPTTDINGKRESFSTLIPRNEFNGFSPSPSTELNNYVPFAIDENGRFHCQTPETVAISLDRDTPISEPDYDDGFDIGDD